MAQLRPYADTIKSLNSSVMLISFGTESGARSWLEEVDQPFTLLNDSRSHLFIAQSGLLATDNLAPNHFAEYTSEREEYRLPAGEDTLDVVLTWTHETGLKVSKIYTFHRGEFVVDLKHRVENGSSEEWVGSQYRQLQRVPPVQSGSMLNGGVYTYTGGVISEMTP